MSLGLSLWGGVVHEKVFFVGWLRHDADVVVVVLMDHDFICRGLVELLGFRFQCQWMCLVVGVFHAMT